MKWLLNHKAGKETCPQCGTKRSLCRYVNENNAVAPMPFGKCDRVYSCCYMALPKQEVKIKEYIPPPKPIDYTSKEIVMPTLTRKNNLYLSLKEIYGAQRTNKVFRDYEVGSSNHWKGATLFWFKDYDFRYRGGMIVLYEGCKRVREPFPHHTWEHSLRDKSYNFKLCLYGEHLLKTSTNPVGVVEAPKSALICALEMPQYTWVATNGLTTLQDYNMTAVKGRDVWLFPDRQPDEFPENMLWLKDYWKKKVPQIAKIAKSVNIFEGLNGYREGTDMADLFI